MLITNKSKTTFVICGALALLAVSSAVMVVRADSTTPPAAAPDAAPAAKGNRVMGAVTAIGPGGSTITVQTRDGQSVVATTIPRTRVSALAPESISDLKSGDIIAVGAGRGADATGTTVTAARILVLPELPAKGEAGQRGVIGTIVTTTPGLTITTDDGTTVAVATTATTRVWGSTPSTLAAVAVGDHVEIRGKASGAGVTARMVTIMPARRG